MMVDEKKESDVGRPGWWEETPEKLTKLEQAFAIGCNDEEACDYAEISPRQLYYYQEIFPDFVGKKHRLKRAPVLKAKNTLFSGLDKVENAKWYLERKLQNEFALKTKPEFSITNQEGGQLLIKWANEEKPKQLTEQREQPTEQ